MLGRLSICLLVAILVLINLSCAKLTKEKPAEVGEVAVEELPYKDSIPSNWGKLVTVSSAPGIDHWVQLWFEDEEGNIRMVAYNIVQNRLSSQAKVFRRK